MFTSCSSNQKSTSANEKEFKFDGSKGKVKIMTLDPSHFHAALVQKNMYKQVDSTVYVYAPEGPDVEGHMTLINSYNTRDENPTSWDEIVYTGSDYLERMMEEKPGNVLVTAGNNAKKTEYILKAVQAEINVLADKPMVISPEEFPKLEEAFKVAENNGALLYDIMTERHEITTILQRELALKQEVFGTLQIGTEDEPAITKESVHHFLKYVSGKPLKRPAWFFDTQQQGDGIVDVTTHLVDLIQWEAFPETILNKNDVEILSAKRWTTDLTPEMFTKVTQMEQYPSFLDKDIDNNVLTVHSNGEFTYLLKGVHAKVSVIWNFEAPEGIGDTHYSIMRGTKCNLVIKQGAEENYKPQLYIQSNEGVDNHEFESDLNTAIQDLTSKYPGIKLEKLNETNWKLDIPEEFKVGHEAHFGQVTQKYLRYLTEGKLPEWEVSNMIVKYYTTTEALKAAR